MEIFCVILGWLLAQATTYINDVKKSQKRKSAMLKMLFNEFNDGVLQTKDMLKDNSFCLPVKVNPWWENNKLLYLIRILVRIKYHGNTQNIIYNYRY